MLENDVLKKKSIAELKKIADDKSLKYDNKIKKNELIELISNKKNNSALKSKTDEKTEKISNKIKEKNTKKSNTSKKEKINQSSTLNNISHAAYQINQFQNSNDLPENYGINKIVLMVVDPHKGYTYWEINENLLNKLNVKYNQIVKYLRIYDITNNKSPENSNEYFDIKINNEAKNWYFEFKNPNRIYIIDLGFIKDNKFITLLRSNVVYVPRDNLSDNIDEEWMNTDENYKLIYQASGANTLFQHDGSKELMKFLAGNLEENLSSGGSSQSSDSNQNKKK